jgi:hypothetical protein
MLEYRLNHRLGDNVLLIRAKGPMGYLIAEGRDQPRIAKASAENGNESTSATERYKPLTTAAITRSTMHAKQFNASNKRCSQTSKEK